jgi:hypothetical protein
VNELITHWTQYEATIPTATIPNASATPAK